MPGSGGADPHGAAALTSMVALIGQPSREYSMATHAVKPSPTLVGRAASVVTTAPPRVSSPLSAAAEIAQGVCRAVARSPIGRVGYWTRSGWTGSPAADVLSDCRSRTPRLFNGATRGGTGAVCGSTPGRRHMTARNPCGRPGSSRVGMRVPSTDSAATSARVKSIPVVSGGGAPASSRWATIGSPARVHPQPSPAAASRAVTRHHPLSPGASPGSSCTRASTISASWRAPPHPTHPIAHRALTLRTPCRISRRIRLLRRCTARLSRSLIIAADRVRIVAAASSGGAGSSAPHEHVSVVAASGTRRCLSRSHDSP